MSLPNLQLTKRDEKINEMIYQYRAVTVDMVARLLFSSNGSAPSSRCYNRLMLLNKHGFLTKQKASKQLPFVSGHPDIYTLDIRGRDLVAEMKGVTIEDLDWNPRDRNIVSSPFIEHLLSTNIVRSAIEIKASSLGLTLAGYKGERFFRRNPIKVSLRSSKGKPRQFGLIPDSFFYLLSKDRKAGFAVEIDLGTEVVSSAKGAYDVQSKILAYQSWVSSGDYFDFARLKSSLRVLTITPGIRRLQNLRQATHITGDSWMFSFALLEDAADVKKVLMEEIWRNSNSDEKFALLH